jgi:hypothetical protein
MPHMSKNYKKTKYETTQRNNKMFQLFRTTINHHKIAIQLQRNVPKVPPLVLDI